MAECKSKRCNNDLTTPCTVDADCLQGGTCTHLPDFLAGEEGVLCRNNGLKDSIVAYCNERIKSAPGCDPNALERSPEQSKSCYVDAILRGTMDDQGDLLEPKNCCLSSHSEPVSHCPRWNLAGAIGDFCRQISKQFPIDFDRAIYK